MSDRVETLIVVIRHMHSLMASLNDIEEIVECTMQDLHFTEEEQAQVRKEIR